MNGKGFDDGYSYLDYDLLSMSILSLVVSFLTWHHYLTPSCCAPNGVYELLPTIVRFDLVQHLVPCHNLKHCWVPPSSIFSWEEIFVREDDLWWVDCEGCLADLTPLPDTFILCAKCNIRAPTYHGWIWFSATSGTTSQFERLLSSSEFYFFLGGGIRKGRWFVMGW